MRRTEFFELLEKMGMQSIGDVPQPTKSVSLGCTNVQFCTEQNVAPQPKTNKEKEMIDIIGQERQMHLRSRLRDERSKHTEELKKHFNMRDDDAPNSAKELLERIAAGRYELMTDDEWKSHKRYYGYDSVLSAFKWRDPKATKDQAGYDAAIAKMDEAYTAAKDIIVVKDAEAGLTAVQDFAKATFH